MICPYSDGNTIRTREFGYDKVTGKIIKQVETVQQIPAKCLGIECPFFDGSHSQYYDITCRRVEKDMEGDI